jgi:hypothetical protein
MILKYIMEDAGRYAETVQLSNTIHIKVKEKKLKNVNVLKALPFGIVISP